MRDGISRATCATNSITRPAQRPATKTFATVTRRSEPQFSLSLSLSLSTYLSVCLSLGRNKSGFEKSEREKGETRGKKRHGWKKTGRVVGRAPRHRWATFPSGYSSPGIRRVCYTHRATLLANGVNAVRRCRAVKFLTLVARPARNSLSLSIHAAP